MQLPVHRWFRYSAGFSAHWVREVIEREKRARGTLRVLDPFAGSGTVMVECDRAGVDSWGLEPHPFVVRVGKAKLLWNASPSDFELFAERILARARRVRGAISGYPRVVRKCFPDELLLQMDQLRRALEEHHDYSVSWWLTWLALVATVRIAAPVNTAHWTYVLPRKPRRVKAPPREAFRLQVRLMADDMHIARKEHWERRSRIDPIDARTCEGVPDSWATTIITSPPYANNYDYADACRLELCFLQEIRGWRDLQTRVRRHLVRSCSQHVAADRERLDALLSDPALDPIRPGVEDACRTLAEERHRHGGKKHYHTMIAAYFCDLARVWRALRRVCERGAKVCFVIGDSAPYGVYVPVHEWLARLAVAAGFRNASFEKIRDRNVKWKNRKHRVPLQEGNLWVEG